MKTNQITKIFVYIFLLLLLCFTSDMQNEWVFVHWGKTISNISNYLNENGDVNTLLSLATIFIMFYYYIKRRNIKGFVTTECLRTGDFGTFAASPEPSGR